MHVLGVLDCGTDDDGLERAVDQLVDRLSARGRVGVVRYDATIADGTAALRNAGVTPGGDVTYDLGVDGDWTACGTGYAVGDALEDLAIDCAFAVVVGAPSIRAPVVAVGPDAQTRVETDEPAGPVLATAATPSAFEYDAVVDALLETEPYETLESLVARVKDSPAADRSGAIATFTGRVRAKDADDDARTEYLEFEKYEGVADERMAALKADLEARDGVYAVELHHRTGVVRDGEDIVFVVVLAGHREEAFRTVEDGINRLKDEVPLFKKEVTVDEEFWVHHRS
ncbi:molybdopterin synthase [Natrononativus amylolyticus]|uniref:molybdopterin synthase n=1 Tax=Natrononativus amylolyticus TaxID=2963434 RepID=UPI0020CB7F0E|nr:molybdopterin synthase [Natrononativus amylolyticus]